MKEQEQEIEEKQCQATSYYNALEVRSIHIIMPGVISLQCFRNKNCSLLLKHLFNYNRLKILCRKRFLMLPGIFYFLFNFFWGGGPFEVTSVY